MYKMIVPVGDLPDGETVIKVGGTIPYVVRRKISIYQDKENTQVIEAKDGVVFLISDRYSGINAVPSKTEMVWQANERQLREYLFPSETPQ